MEEVHDYNLRTKRIATQGNASQAPKNTNKQSTSGKAPKPRKDTTIGNSTSTPTAATFLAQLVTPLNCDIIEDMKNPKANIYLFDLT